MLLVNKMDTEGSEEKYQEVRRVMKDFKGKALGQFLCNLDFRGLLGFVSTYKEDFRPNNPINFADTLAISAKENQSDVQRVKTRLRNLLDLMSEPESEDVYSELKKPFVEKGPVLV